MQLEKEVRELTKQRNLAQSRIEELLTVVRNNQERKTWEDECSVSESSGLADSRLGEKTFGSTQDFAKINKTNEEDDYMSDDTSSSLSNRHKFVLRSGEDSDDNCKDVRCIEMDESTSRSPVFSHEENERRMSTFLVSTNGEVRDEELVSTTNREASRVENGFTFGSLEQKFQDVQKTIDSLVSPYGDEQSPSANTPSSSGLKLARSWSCRANLMSGSSSSFGFEMEGQSESTPPPRGFEKKFHGRPEVFQRRLPPLNYEGDGARLSRNDSQSSVGSALTEGLKFQNNGNGGDEGIPSVDTFVAGLKEMAKVQYDYRVRMGLFFIAGLSLH